jgi:peroxiredoxin
MMKHFTFLTATLVASLAISCRSQTPPPEGASRGSTSTALAARKAAVAAEVASAAATARFASIRMSLGSMLMDSMLGAGAADSELTGYRNEEILKAMSEQLEQFIAAYPGVPEADVARALLARIYVKLGRTADAVRILRAFDADRASTSEVLQVVMSIQAVQDIATSAEEWLVNISKEEPSLDARFDAADVAIRLEKYELAEQILENIRTTEKTPEGIAGVLLGQAELVHRLLGRSPVAIAAPKPPTGDGPQPMYPLLPFAKGEMHEGPAEEEASPETDAGFGGRISATQAERFRNSKVYADISRQAVNGLRIMKSLAQVEFDSARMFEERYLDGPHEPLEIPVATLTRALQLEAVHLHPGTAAARTAAIRIEADSLANGKRALPIEATTMDGQRIASADFLGKVLLIDFFVAVDQRCITERDKLEKLRQLYPATDFEILTVSMDAAADGWVLESAIEALELSGPIVFDGAGTHTSIARRYGIDALPARVLVARDGTIAECKPWKLDIDSLPIAVEAALRAPRKTMPYEATALVIEEPYFGAPMTASLRRGPDSTAAWIEAEAWVPDEPCTFVVEQIDAMPESTSVYLKLTFDQARRAAPTATTLSKKVVKAVLPATAKGAVKVYVNHATMDLASTAQPRLLTVLPMEETPVYAGPKLHVEVLSTDSLPPQWSLNIETTLAAETANMRVDKIGADPDCTDVYVTLKHSPSRSSNPTGERRRLFVALGKDVAPVIRVHVQVIDTDKNQTVDYALAAKIEN